MTNRQYRDVEVALDVWPDFGCDSGLLLRSSEDGAAYQVMIDYLEGGNVGSRPWPQTKLCGWQPQP